MNEVRCRPVQIISVDGTAHRVPVVTDTKCSQCLQFFGKKLFYLLMVDNKNTKGEDDMRVRNVKK